MATFTIRNVPDHVRDALRVRAAKMGRSMEAELRAMVTSQLAPEPTPEDRQAFEAAFDAAQVDFAPYRNPKILASDELIAERRLEAWRETVEFHDQISSQTHG